MSVKAQAINGIKWSALDRSVQLFLEFFIGVVLARLLSPGEFGLIGMLTIFLAISEIFVDSGLSQALIVKKDCSQIDYSTVFYTNILIGVVCYVALYSSARYISVFFNRIELTSLTRVLGINTLLNSFGIVETAILTKKVDFKTQTKISFVSSVISGIIGVGMAFLNFGVWSLVYRQLAKNLIRNVLLYIYSSWRPTLDYSIKALRSFFSFGSKLLFVGLINVIFNNVYSIAIGKYFMAEDLGYFTRAKQFKDIPTTFIDGTVLRVSYPILSSISDDEKKLVHTYTQYLKLSFFITAVAMAWVFLCSDEIVYLLLGEKWMMSAVYLKPLCVVGMIYPLHTINQNIFKIKYRTDLFLYLELLKKIFVVITVYIGIIYGLKSMMYLMILNSMLSYLATTYFTGRIIDLPLLTQVKSIMPTIVILSLSLLPALILQYSSALTNFPVLLQFIIKSLVLLVIFVTLSIVSKLWEFSTIIKTLKAQLQRRK